MFIQKILSVLFAIQIRPRMDAAEEEEDIIYCKVFANTTQIHTFTIRPNKIAWCLNGLPIFIECLQFCAMHFEFYDKFLNKIENSEMNEKYDIVCYGLNDFEVEGLKLVMPNVVENSIVFKLSKDQEYIHYCGLFQQITKEKLRFTQRIEIGPI